MLGVERGYTEERNGGKKIFLRIATEKDWCSLCVCVYTYIPETMSLRNTTLLSHSVATVYGAQITSCCVGSNVLLHKHFPKYVCSAQYGRFLYFLNFVVSWYGAHLFSEWFWNSSSRSYYYWYHPSFYIPHINIIIIIIISGSVAQRGLWPRSTGFVITHDSPQSVGLLWTSDQLVA
jgi:hypothetical protein